MARAQAMINLLGRFADIIVARLNQAPQQHFLAFLSEGGVDQLPPRAAATRLFLMPEKDAQPTIPVPAGTQVATRPSGDQPEVVFETAHAVQVIPTELKWCIAVDQRTSADQSRRANGQETGAFAAFQGEDVRERILYLRDDRLLSFPDAATRDNATVILNFELDPAVQPTGEWQLIWSYFDGKQWTPLANTPAQVADETGGLMRSGVVRFTRLPEIAAAEVNGEKGIWIQCRLAPISEQMTLPRIFGITIQREIAVSRQEVIPQALTATQAGIAFTPVKAEDAFYPFGQFPALLDGFYIRADEALTKPGATVELRFTADGLPSKLDDTSTLEALTLVWEYHSIEGWTRLGASRWGCPEMVFIDTHDPLIKGIRVRSGSQGKQVEIELPKDYAGDKPPPGFPPKARLRRSFTGRVLCDIDLSAAGGDLPGRIIERGRSYTAERLDFRDTTCAFTAAGAGAMTFSVPTASGTDPAFAPTEVNGQTGYWVRASVIEGGFSEPQPTPGGLLQKVLIGKLPARPPSPIPPLVRDFHADYTDYRTDEGPRSAQSCIGKTDGGWRSQVTGQGFMPFSTSVEHAALYMGFLPLDTDPAKGKVAFPANTWVELYLGLEEVGDEPSSSDLRWQYWNGQGWQALGVVDETLDLWRSGIVGFFAPSDHKASAEFGQTAYWLRLCPADAVAPKGSKETEAEGATTVAPMPRLASLRLNTVPANNGETITDEVLGSSSGDKNQVFRLSHPPVLADAEIEVLEQDEKNEASEHIWIRWVRTSSLITSGPNDRCYILDPTSGAITFGDRAHGMIPPAGHNNIRAKRYCTHGGKKGNVAAGAVTTLRNPKGALNAIRRAANIEPGAGGADLEQTAHVELRGPHSLKNRDRAVTTEDFEWLAREIPGAHRVFCLPTRKRDGTNEPGWITIIVVPGRRYTVHDTEGRPMPMPSLLRQVREHLAARGLVNLASAALETSQATPSSLTDQIHVTGPGYVEVEVVAKVVPKDPTLADNTRKEVLAQLAAFLDPVDGGPERQGWQAGRDVFISEIKAEIESVSGVDHVQSAFLRIPSRQQQFLLLEQGTSVGWPVAVGSQVSTFDNRLRATLGSRLPENASIEFLDIVGFNTGDTAVIARVQDPAPYVRRISVTHGDAAEVVFDLPIDFGNEALFQQWRDELGKAAALVSQDGRHRAPITDYRTETDTTGRVHLQGVRVAEFVAGEPVSITDTGRRNRRIDFLPVRDIAAWERRYRIFVPSDHLVFSGSHQIEMVVEETHARQAA